MKPESPPVAPLDFTRYQVGVKKRPESNLKCNTRHKGSYVHASRRFLLSIQKETSVRRASCPVLADTSPAGHQGRLYTAEADLHHFGKQSDISSNTDGYGCDAATWKLFPRWRQGCYTSY